MVARELHFITVQAGAERGGSRMCWVTQNKGGIKMSCFSSTPQYIYRCDLLYSSRRQSSSFRFRLASGANATSHHSGIWQVFRSKRCNEPRSREPPLRISPPPTSSNMSENQQECDRRPPTPPFLEFLINLSISQRYTSPSTSASFRTEAWHLHLSFA